MVSGKQKQMCSAAASFVPAKHVLGSVSASGSKPGGSSRDGSFAAKTANCALERGRRSITNSGTTPCQSAVGSRVLSATTDVNRWAVVSRIL
jgi:hypothetical protein